MDFGVERRLGKNWNGVEFLRPGGMRGGTEPPVGSSGRAFFCFVPLTLLWPQGAGRI